MLQQDTSSFWITQRGRNAIRSELHMCLTMLSSFLHHIFDGNLTKTSTCQSHSKKECCELYYEISSEILTSNTRLNPRAKSSVGVLGQTRVTQQDSFIVSF